MSVQVAQLEKWLQSGDLIATNYYDRLQDSFDDFRGDFDSIYYFADNEKTKPIFLSYASRTLKESLKKISDLEMKSALRNFLATTEVLLVKNKKEEDVDEVKRYLIENNLKPVLATPQEEEEQQERKRVSLWHRIDKRVRRIGIFFEAIAEDGPEILAAIFYIILGLIVLIAFIGTWINEGFGWAILVGLIVGGIASVLMKIGEVIAVIFGKVIFYILRGIFYNVYTLLAFLFIFFILPTICGLIFSAVV